MTATRIRSSQIKTITDVDVAAANKDGAVGVAGLRTLGTGANQALPGNTPVSGAFTSADGGISITSGTQLIINPAWLNQLNMINGRLNYAIVSSSLQIKITTIDGSDPTAANPVKVIFRDAAEGGMLYILTLTTATSITIPTPARMGFKVNCASRIWVVAFNDGGTFRMGVINCYSQDVDFTSAANQIYNLSEERPVTTTLIDTASHLSGKFYTAGAAITSPARHCRALGYLEWRAGLVTPGTWVAPTKVQNFRQGLKLPGDVVQRATNYIGAANTGTGVIAIGTGIPQITQGSQFIQTIITPASDCNVMRLYAVANTTISTANVVCGAIFRGSDTDAITAGLFSPNVAQGMLQLLLEYQQQANANNQDLGYTLRLGDSVAGTVYLNRNSTVTPLFGGVNFSCLNVEEIQA